MKKLLMFVRDLKSSVASISIDYEHIRYAGPLLWKALYFVKGLL